MKAAFFIALLLMILISFIPWGIQTDRISSLDQPEFLTNLTSSTPFDFSQQWRRIKRDSDELIRTKELYTSRMQGITPLWACVYSRDAHSAQGPLIKNTIDGGLIVVCNHYPDPKRYRRATLIKLSDKGQIQWQHTYRSVSSPITGSVTINTIEQTNDGGYLLGGKTSVNDASQFVIFKLFSYGKIEWVYSYGGILGQNAHSIKQTKEGGFIVLGITTSYKHPFFEDPFWDFDVNLLVIKLSPDGIIEWQRVIGGPKWESEWLGESRTSTIIESSHGGYLVVCDTPSFSNNAWPDLWAVKLSDLGDIEWQKIFAGKESEWLINPGTYAIETTDGKYIIACHTYSYGVVDPDAKLRYSEVWVIKLKPNGDIEWQRTYGGKGSDTVRAVLATDNGGCIVAGASNSWSGSTLPDFWVFKLSPAGNIIWQRTYGGELWDEATSICVTNDNGLAVAGTTFSFDNEYEDLLVLKLTSDGKLDTVCSNLFGNSNAVVMDTDCVNFDTYETARVSDAIEMLPIISTEDVFLKKRIVCWNFNQPPVNLYFERQENKSFFASEAWHTITWSPNPYNSQFSIAEYRIYRKNTDYETSSYYLIGTVSANINIFVDSKTATGMNENANYLYVVTSIDSEGNESSWSEAVGNLD